MTKPSKDDLEAIALSNQLNQLMSFPRAIGENKFFDERIEKFKARYKEVTGRDFVYEDPKGKYTD